VDTPVISIVDDDDYMRVATEGLLRSLGYKTHSFAGAEDFLNSGLAETSACVISDIQMPGTDGLALQAKMRAKGWNAPMIFITAFPSPAIEARARKQGAICFLSKPFDSDVLARCIETALKGGAAHQH
jgi:FixJ family two-component response regulator